jgi:hypothetical protein
MKGLLLLVAVLGALAYGMFNYHVIRTDDGVRFLKKAEPTLEDVYIDARGANRAKLILNPALLRAGIKEILRQAGN